MTFKTAFSFMKDEGKKVKLPSWGGYWYWDDEKQTIIMHTKDGKELDIRETDNVAYTMSNICELSWEIATELNCPSLGGDISLGFRDALHYIKRGFKMRRKAWQPGMFIREQSSKFSIDDVDAKDWEFYNEE